MNLIPEADSLLGFNDPRLSLIREDPRRKWLASSHERYDVVLVSLAPPATLGASRFYSVEFYRLILRLLADDGIMAIVLPGSETYLTPPLTDLLASVFGAVKEVLPYSLAVPGDHTLLL